MKEACTMASSMDNKQIDVTANYSKLLLRGLHSLYISKQFSDVKVLVENHVFCAHRNVLAAACPFFHAMLTGELMEKSQSEVVVNGVSPEIFEILLEFLYTGQVHVTEETCQDLLAAADMFSVYDVMTECCSYLKKQLHPSNCIGIYIFADAHSCFDLALAAEAFIYSHFLEVTKEEEYLNLPKNLLVNILSSENLKVESEYQVFVAAMKWILHNPPERRKSVFEVLANIRFPVISQKKLERYIEDCPDLSLKIAVRKLVQDFRCDRRMSCDQRHIMPLLFKPRNNSLKSIYVIGGYSRHRGGRWSDSQSLGTVECYKTFHHKWKTVPPLHHARSGHGVCMLSGCVYAIGGESDSLIFANAECFDPAVNKWSMIPSMTVPRCALGVTVVEDKIYAIGGWVGSQIGHTVERYDPVLNHWSHWDEVNMPRFAMGVIEHSGLVYIIGGISDVGTEMSSVESYNPVTKEWLRLSDMITKRAYVGVACYDNDIYAIGGWNEDKGALNTVEKYSIDEGTWVYVCPMSMPRAGTAVAAVNGMIYAIGGRMCNDDFSYSAPSTTDSVECYDTQMDLWIDVGPMPTSRCEAGVVIL